VSISLVKAIRVRVRSLGQLLWLHATRITFQVTPVAPRVRSCEGSRPTIFTLFVPPQAVRGCLKSLKPMRDG
jgi:hypothetical protein